MAPKEVDMLCSVKRVVKPQYYVTLFSPDLYMHIRIYLMFYLTFTLELLMDNYLEGLVSHFSCGAVAIRIFLNQNSSKLANSIITQSPPHGGKCHVTLTKL